MEQQVKYNLVNIMPEDELQNFSIEDSLAMQKSLDELEFQNPKSCHF
jgi:hypothetical protein